MRSAARSSNSATTPAIDATTIVLSPTRISLRIETRITARLSPTAANRNCRKPGEHTGAQTHKSTRGAAAPTGADGPPAPTRDGTRAGPPAAQLAFQRTRPPRTPRVD